MLSPVNYFDYDVTMESKNAILLYSPKEQGGAYGFDDNGVKENFHCLPEAPPAFEYSEMAIMGVDGFVDVDRSAEIRQVQQMFVKLKAI